jgi:hypothetical protein
MGFVSGIALAVAAVAAAPAGGDATTEWVRPCPTHIEGPGQLTIDKARDVRVGPVVWFGLANPRTSRPGKFRGSDPSVKSAIAVRAGGPVLLRIPSEARGEISMVYGAERDGTLPNVERVGEGQWLVRVTPCRPSRRRFSDGRRIGPWTAFNGGFVMRAAGCYPIEVARRGEPFRRRTLGFGKRCQKS